MPDQAVEAASQPPSPQDGAAAEKFQGYAVQRGWLNRARGKTVQVRFLDGKGVKGELVGHDNYCLSVKLEAAPEPVLVFKHAIAYLARLAQAKEATRRFRALVLVVGDAARPMG